jgi:hypothetical protein
MFFKCRMACSKGDPGHSGRWKGYSVPSAREAGNLPIFRLPIPLYQRYAKPFETLVDRSLVKVGLSNDAPA